MSALKLHFLMLLTLGTGTAFAVSSWRGMDGSGLQAGGGTGGCKSSVVTLGWSNDSANRAETRALVNWSSTASSRFGSRYAIWHNASRRSLDCYRVHGAYKCTIKARPCAMGQAADEPPHQF